MAKEKLDNEKKTEKLIEEQEKSFKAKLDAEPKVKVIIPMNGLNPSDPEIIGVNGIIYKIKRGVEVEIPQTIYRVWMESYNETIKVQQRIKIANMGGDAIEVYEG